MLNFSTIKILIIVFICAFGAAVAAPNLVSRETAESLPDWLPHKQINLGLDLQGGSHLLMEVETGSVIKESLNSLVDEIRTAFSKARIGYTGLGVQGMGVSVKLRDPSRLEEARGLIRDIDKQLVIDTKESGLITVHWSDFAIKERTKSIVEQSIEIVGRRVDETGTREPTIQREGEDRILIQLPGVKDPERIKQLLGKTAKLTFHLVDSSASPVDAQSGRVPPGDMVLPVPGFSS